MVNLAYLLISRPLLTSGENKLEIFDEVCILACSYTSCMLLNTGLSADIKNTLGFNYIGVASLSILFNLSVAITNSLKAFVVSIRTSYYFNQAHKAF